MIEERTLRSTRPKARFGWPARVGLLGILLLLEKFALDTLVDPRRAGAAQGMGAVVRHTQHWGFRFLVTFLAAVSMLASVRALQQPNPSDESAPVPGVRFRWIITHGILVGVLAPLTYALYRGESTPLSFATLVIVWVFLAAAAVMAAIIGLAPWATWFQGIRSLGTGWLYAGLAALAGISVWQQSERLWKSVAALTFELVKLVLIPILPNLSADAATHVIRADRFAVQITDVCSGLEGLGLMLVFTVMWLSYFRREYIFPRALLLIPVSLAAIFGLNVLRIAALMLIGNAGFPEIASYGFHSQAGWIAFNAVACALVFFSRRSRWLTRPAPTPESNSTTYNAAATYLMPLLAILAAGTLSHAMSGKFEALYPLRLIAGVAVLIAYRPKLAKIDWTFSWRGPATGMVIFLVWVALGHIAAPPSSLPSALSSLPPLSRNTWILCRSLASILTVPIAEELAYRGFLMRRVGHEAFESLPYGSVRWGALLVSAIVFGLGHGAMWLPGIIAGLGYGKLVIRSGRLGEAVAAHATTNALLAIYVLTMDQWQFW